jgi:EAL and modified HD-GYP domain-containing signal transduction protein
VVLEVLENVAVDAQLIDGVRRLSAQGFSIALDDFVYAEKWEPLLELADIVKVEIPALGHAQIAAHLKLLRRYDVQVLAEKIETEEDFERLREMGFDLFQGYFLARPKVLKGSRIPSNRLGMLRMLAALQDPDIRMEELGRTITQDVSMCYRMLRYINSAFFALPCKVESIQQAVAYLGLNNVRRWASLIAMSGFHSRPSELLRLALVRARLSEQLAEAAGRADADVYFTLGLFSILDSLLGLPMPVILNELPLADDLQAALLTRQGPLGQALECTLSFETTDLALITYAGLPLHTIQEIYVEALAWADENGQQLW